jgi:hypothetical protein
MNWRDDRIEENIVSNNILNLKVWFWIIITNWLHMKDWFIHCNLDLKVWLGIILKIDKELNFCLLSINSFRKFRIRIIMKAH